jgi:hypothetical protein
MHSCTHALTRCLAARRPQTIDGAGGVYPDATVEPLDDPRVETLAEYVLMQSY